MDQQLHKALVDALHAFKAKPESERIGHRIAKIGNSPFVLTILGGILLALVSGMISECTARSTKDRELAVERLRAKQAFVQTFSSKVERYFELTLSVRQREMWLSAWQHSDQRSTIHYPDGRSFDETRAQWEQDKKYWLDQSTESPTGLINAGRILFSDQSVRNELDRLSQAARLYGGASTYEDFDKAYAEALDSLEKASFSMANHVYEK